VRAAPRFLLRNGTAVAAISTPSHGVAYDRGYAFRSRRAALPGFPQPQPNRSKIKKARACLAG